MLLNDSQLKTPDTDTEQHIHLLALVFVLSYFIAYRPRSNKALEPRTTCVFGKWLTYLYHYELVRIYIYVSQRASLAHIHILSVSVWTARIGIIEMYYVFEFEFE
jgi:hypothetical protein